MNSKKHKSKNRAKVISSKPRAEVEKKSDDGAVEKLPESSLNPDLTQDKSDVTKATEEIKVKIEEINVKNEEISIENEDKTESTAEITSTTETPVKPKRNKNKKKKQAITEEKQKDTNIEESQKAVIIEENSSLSNVNETKIDDVKPNARKKKNKDKKHAEKPHETEIESKSDIDLPNPGSVTPNQQMTDEEPFQIEVKRNKKNKKKKRRNDSEKSDKPDEAVSCTTAFEDLIEKKTDNGNTEIVEIKDNQKTCKEESTECTKPEVMLSTENQQPNDSKNAQEDGNITHKKKKKGKKQLPEIKDDKQKDNNEPSPVEINDNKSEILNTVECQPICEEKPIEAKDDAIEITPLKTDATEEIKPKAIIAKPVQKKPVQSLDLKNVTETKITEILEPTILDSNISNTDNKVLDDNLISTNESIILPPKDSDASQFENVKVLEENTSNIELFDCPTEKSMSEKKLTDKCQKCTIETDTLEIELESNVGFNIQIQDTNANIKQDDQPKILKEMPRKDKSKAKRQVKCSETDDYDTGTSDESHYNITDHVQGPRSVSQQLLDDNIQEVTSRHSKMSNIPVPSTIVQDSREKPSRTSTKTPDACVPDTTHQEKTDLKSKMMEVNKDLEQIRISLEKSLAELTAMKEQEEKMARNDCDVETSKKSTPEKSSKGINAPIPSKYIKSVQLKTKNDNIDNSDSTTPPISPRRKDQKCRAKKKKREQETVSQTVSVTSESRNTSTNESKCKEKSNSSDDRSQQQSSCEKERNKTMSTDVQFEPIENFEDALTSSVDDVDVNRTFEIIASELNQGDQPQKESFISKPEINITPPLDEEENKGQSKNLNPVSQPKNLLGCPNIPVPSNKTDYKKERNKTPNEQQAKVKIKDFINSELDDESAKKSKQSQTESKIKFIKDKNEIESFSYVNNGNEEYVYKYIFRKVYLSSVCHICRKDLKRNRVPCKFCNLLFYCSQKHKDEDWPRHQSLCFAVSTIVHLKDQKHIYSDTRNVTGQNYRFIRMQMILSCEKVLKRKLLPWEQEALLYPRMCADVTCREWRQTKLMDCDGCGQVSYCIENPEHLPTAHKRWCKPYSLYQKLVLHQQEHGRLEPRLPSKVMTYYSIPDKLNEVLASIYEEKIDMSDVQYAALTQLASAPLTVAFCHQLHRHAVDATTVTVNGHNKRSTFTVHLVGAELQLEADNLGKWEVFLLHLKPGLKELRVALVGHDLNAANLPLDLLAKIRSCENCRVNKRRVLFSFQDKKSYQEYWASDDFIIPDIVCAFNPNIHRSSLYNGVELWSSTINCIFKLKIPFLITSSTIKELKNDLEAIKKNTEVDYNVVSEVKLNPFASVRPDRNFITDDESPLLFKNYCFSLLCGA
ncbi:PREDICTED: intracellular protein transport protein USO1 [Papilio polytes]|uniref:intracellular protein transport protein USO1 n=1 Tax=Papilio polytes TaxID=76194 RepID=UPI000675C9FB|nr:PREDICTED: intracellular protein transport protein USO1 [Papilio polytes]